MRVIGFTGRAGAGKSTAARALVSAGWRSAHFAGPLKDALAVIMRANGMRGPDIHRALNGADKNKPCDALGGRTPRRAMQTLGTEWGRNVLGHDFWLMPMRRLWTSAVYAGVKGLVIDDARFANEWHLIRDEFDGIVIEIVGKNGVADGHASEASTGLEPDGRVENVGMSKETFQAMIRERFV